MNLMDSCDVLAAVHIRNKAHGRAWWRRHPGTDVPLARVSHLAPSEGLTRLLFFFFSF